MTIEQRFQQYHKANPKVYAKLVELARFMKTVKGQSRFTIGLLYEIIRNDYYSGITKGEKYVLPNEFRSRYARLIMANDPFLTGVFNTRELQAA